MKYLGSSVFCRSRSDNNAVTLQLILMEDVSARNSLPHPTTQHRPSPSPLRTDNNSLFGPRDAAKGPASTEGPMNSRHAEKKGKRKGRREAESLTF